MEVHVLSPFERLVPMDRDSSDYWSATVEDAGHGMLYRYRLDNELERPDPASHYQPDGVHGPSMAVDHSRYAWSNDGGGKRQLDDYIIYEMHVGTFTAGGTFSSAISRLPHLVELGITAVEIMPVAQFPGNRNWGYDGVYPFATQHSYGGVDGLKQFVDACHEHGLAVILDVVYNHLGPEGNYLRDFGPYFTDRYKTPWGESLNFDGPCSDGVCDFFISNACYWLAQFHIDALRLDAVHAICDMGARPFLQRLSETVEEKFRSHVPPKYLIAESDLNDVRVIQERSTGGLGLHAQWSDDFHHALHTLLVGETRGYYADFGEVEHMVYAMNEAFCYSGTYSRSRKRTHGNDASSLNTGKFVVCSQNHDQIGNRMLGERLLGLTGTDQARLAAAAVILSPYVPLLFMGEEHGEDHPFLYFVDHSDERLRVAVCEGRKREFAEFHDAGEPLDPFDIRTFEQSKPDWAKQSTPAGLSMLRLYRELIRIRRTSPAIGPGNRDTIDVGRFPSTSCIDIHYRHPARPVQCLFNFATDSACFQLSATRMWTKVLDSRTFHDTDPGTELPAHIAEGDNTVCMMPYGFAVYEGHE